MTNEEIIIKATSGENYDAPFTYTTITEYMNLARADEREKLSKEIIKLRDTILAECCICCNNFDPSISRKEIVAIFNTFGIYNGFIEIPETEKGV